MEKNTGTKLLTGSVKTYVFKIVSIFLISCTNELGRIFRSKYYQAMLPKIFRLIGEMSRIFLFQGCTLLQTFTFGK